MNNKIFGIVKNMKESNLQDSMRDKWKGKEEIRLDYKLALYFYNFLTEKSEKLPAYEYIDRVISMYSFSSNYQIISVGCGISVIINIIDGERFINLEINSPINEGTLRIDKISKDGHEAYVTNSVYVEYLDVEEFPLFDKERISYVRKYLREYKYNPINEERKLR